MDKTYLDKVFSEQRMQKYFHAHMGNEAKAMLHYQCNIAVSEAFYPVLSVLEVALRNSINRELQTKFGVDDWYTYFPVTAGLGKLMTDVTKAQSQIARRKELVTSSKIVAELTLGFWVRLFNAEFERILWKDLRRAFPWLPKKHRQRHNISAPLNNFRNFRNRIFHNEPICWNFANLQQRHDEMIKVLYWINKNLPPWIRSVDNLPVTLAAVQSKLM